MVIEHPTYVSTTQTYEQLAQVIIINITVILLNIWFIWTTIIVILLLRSWISCSQIYIN